MSRAVLLLTELAHDGAEQPAGDGHAEHADDRELGDEQREDDLEERARSRGADHVGAAVVGHFQRRTRTA